ncbi:unnamed protein product [Adineta ricciae]|uniref:Uncharacterized protein n=1 Tax=Adineta ricciae TaxID=249248 RepID=A0A814VF93_ADIRI|nr:unnamed protein product [Adineta ricciae]
MTSLVLFKSDRSENDEPIQPTKHWGTGKARVRGSQSAAPRLSGNFLYTGEPITQTYRNTDLVLSNLRNNDELVPAPLHTTDITSHQISLEFPSNHPYTSHISEKALFPTSTDGLNDRPSTSVEPYIVTHKIRGNPFRREVHFHGFQAANHCRTSKWPDKSYMHLPRSLSDVNSSSIYPWPRKMFAPNNDNSAANSVKKAGSRVVQNTKTTTPSSNKQKSYLNRTSHSVAPGDNMHGNQQQTRVSSRQKATTYHSPMPATRLMSENDRLDHQLRQGTDYVNLPGHLFPNEKAPTWNPQQQQQQSTNENQNGPQEIRFLQTARVSTANGQLYNDHYASHQQMEAENRLQQLEVIRPKENLNLLNVKYRHLQNPRHPRPILPQYRDDYVNTFYDQVGNYVQERSGLYHTDSYDPTVLAQAIPELENEQNVVSSSVDETDLGNLLNQGEQNQNRTKPKLFQYRALGDYQNMRNRLLNKLHVPQDAGTVDSRTQEGDKPFIQRESVYGQAYNTRKFLQENALPHHARVDPTNLMSTKYNTNLERTRSLNSYALKTAPTKAKSNDHLVSPDLYPPHTNALYTTNHITEHTDGYVRRPTARVYDSPFQSEQNPSVHQIYQNQVAQPQQARSFDPALQMPSQLANSVKVDIRLPGSEMVARFVEPKYETQTTYQRSFKDISYQEGQPQGYAQHTEQLRPQTSDVSSSQRKLTDIQDRWSKTQAQQQYQQENPNVPPYSSDTIMRAKKEVLLADSIAKYQAMVVR